MRTPLQDWGHPEVLARRHTVFVHCPSSLGALLALSDPKVQSRPCLVFQKGRKKQLKICFKFPVRLSHFLSCCSNGFLWWRQRVRPGGRRRRCWVPSALVHTDLIRRWIRKVRRRAWWVGQVHGAS